MGWPCKTKMKRYGLNYCPFKAAFSGIIRVRCLVGGSVFLMDFCILIFRTSQRNDTKWYWDKEIYIYVYGTSDGTTQRASRRDSHGGPSSWGDTDGERCAIY